MLERALLGGRGAAKRPRSKPVALSQLVGSIKWLTFFSTNRKDARPASKQIHKHPMAIKMLLFLVLRVLSQSGLHLGRDVR